jgi:hypothetical protein
MAVRRLKKSLAFLRAIEDLAESLMKALAGGGKLLLARGAAPVTPALARQIDSEAASR